MVAITQKLEELSTKIDKISELTEKIDKLNETLNN